MADIRQAANWMLQGLDVQRRGRKFWLSPMVGGSEAGISARLRDLRKPRFGGYTVERRRVDGGLFEYRILLEE